MEAGAGSSANWGPGEKKAGKDQSEMSATLLKLTLFTLELVPILN